MYYQQNGYYLEQKTLFFYVIIQNQYGFLSKAGI